MPARISANPEINLALDGPWSLGEEAFSWILAEIGKVSPKCILEFGSGISSVRLALAFPEASVLSVDHHAEFFRRTKQLAAASGVKNLEVLLSPIRKRWLGAARYETYDLPGFDGRSFDAVLIDGPPGHFLFGREACLYVCYETIRKNGIIILDDHVRPMEQLAVRNWQKRYPGSFDVTTEPIGHGLAVLRKRNRRRFLWSISVSISNAAEWNRRSRKYSDTNNDNWAPLRLTRTIPRMAKGIIRRIPILHPILSDLRAKYHSRRKTKDQKRSS
ncbi:O-methyltransferase [Pseudomonadota bacterium]